MPQQAMKESTDDDKRKSIDHPSGNIDYFDDDDEAFDTGQDDDQMSKDVIDDTVTSKGDDYHSSQSETGQDNEDDRALSVNAKTDDYYSETGQDDNLGNDEFYANDDAVSTKSDDSDDRSSLYSSD